MEHYPKGDFMESDLHSSNDRKTIECVRISELIVEHCPKDDFMESELHSIILQSKTYKINIAIEKTLNRDIY